MISDTSSANETVANREVSDSQEYVYVIFPYLRSTRSINICGIDLYPSVDFSEVPAGARDHVVTLSKMFYLRGDYRIREVLYSVFPLKNPNQIARVAARIRRVQSLISYVYASPTGLGDLFQDPSVATVFMFTANEISPFLIEGGPLTEDVKNLVGESDTNRTMDQVPGYEGLLDFRSHVWVARGSRVYPPEPNPVLNLSQDLAMDVEHYLDQPQTWPMQRLFEDPSESIGEFDRRIFTSMKWYNRSARENSDPEEALVDLAIAFESLLGLESSSRVTERFQESVRMLLGDLPRLDSWLEQFYKARSSIVHEGRAIQLQYLSVDRAQLSRALNGNAPDREFLPLVAYGWQVFRLCLITIVTGEAMISMTNLEQDLVHSQERIDRICEILSKSDEPPAKRINNVASHIDALESNWLVSTSAIAPASMVAACRLTLKTLVEIPIAGPRGNVQELASIVDQLDRHGVEKAYLLRHAEQLLPGVRDTDQKDPLVTDAIDSSLRIIRLALNIVPILLSSE